MTSQTSENHEHITDLLPAYMNGRLEDASLRQVREHLLSCAVCQQEFATWELFKARPGRSLLRPRCLPCS